MPRDFAGRSRTTKRKPTRRKPSKRVSPRSKVAFHGPSFSGGALVGAAIVIVAAYAPELVDSTDVQHVNDPAAVTAPARPQVKFEFPKLLKEQEVQADPEPYAVPESAKDDAATSYSIQAASFRSRDDAEQLRARLLLQDLPAASSKSEVSGSTWYRVTVGPFARKVEAQRAMTKLRDQGLSAMWLSG